MCRIAVPRHGFISTEERGKFAAEERKYITIPARAEDFNEIYPNAGSRVELSFHYSFLEWIGQSVVVPSS